MRLEKTEQGQFGGFGGVIESGSQRQPVRKPKAILERKVELTERDFGIFEFILDMKFARVSDIFTKFFSKTLAAEDAKSEAWAKKRLFQLEQARFLRSTYSNMDSEKYFTTTLKAYHALSNMYPERTLTKPIKGFDQRTLTHDRLVIDWRLDCERKLGAVDWISDRRLKSHVAHAFGLSSTNVPDGIYRLPSGEIVAFELEIAQKARVRYRDKIEQYVRLIRERREDPQMFKRVCFLCLKSTVAKILKDEANMYGDLIVVEMADPSFVSKKGGLL